MTFGNTTLVDLTSRRRRRIRAAVAAGAGLAALTGVVACSSSSSPAAAPGSGTAAGRPSSAASSPVADTRASIASTPKSGARHVNPVTPISLRVRGGHLTHVVMTNQLGTHVSAATAASKTSWHTTEVLGYGRAYTIRATAVSTSGQRTIRTIRFQTMTPRAQVDASLERMGGYGLTSGATYGVGIVPVVHFDAPVHDRAAVQRQLTVTTSRHVDGVWSWRDSQDVAYRPQHFWPAHTTVTIHAKVYGVDTGHGVYGASDESTHFTIGRRQITIADDNAPQSVDKVRVFNAHHKLLHIMDTSMGQHSGETVDGQYINFYTLDGTYTVLEHDNPAIMDSQSYGLPADAPNGYGKLSVPYSTKISTDGIYLHEYNSTEYDQEHGIDVSEGCLNLVTADAVWFYDHSLIGDPVIVHGAKGAPEIQPWEGGYWSEPWKTWKADSATS